MEIFRRMPIYICIYIYVCVCMQNAYVNNKLYLSCAFMHKHTLTHVCDTYVISLYNITPHNMDNFMHGSTTPSLLHWNLFREIVQTWHFVEIILFSYSMILNIG